MPKSIAISAALLIAAATVTAASLANGQSSVLTEGPLQPLGGRTYTIRAGPVANADAEAVVGSFQILQAGGPEAIPSTGLSGGCLEFHPADLGFTRMAAKQCQRNSECSTPGENEFAACDTQTGQCWSRPPGPAASAALCHRGITPPVNALVPVPAQPVDVRQFGIQRGAHVRVGACLNKAGIDPRVTGCQTSDGPDKIQVWGPVARIR